MQKKRYEIRLKFLTVLILLTLVSSCKEERKTRVLLIGNSLTYYNEMPEMLQSMFDEDGGSFDVLIIGTGYGSAVAELRLAQVVKRCLMLEMGMDWSASGIPFSSMA